MYIGQRRPCVGHFRGSMAGGLVSGEVYSMSEAHEITRWSVAEGLGDSSLLVSVSVALAPR